jgi:hypothetical protein
LIRAVELHDDQLAVRLWDIRRCRFVLETERELLNSTCSPSDEQAGCESSYGPLVSCINEVPSGLIAKI